MDNLATKVVEVGNSQALLYPGGYEDFLYWKKQQELGLAAPLPKAPRPHVSHAKPAPAGKASAAAATAKATPSTPKAVEPKRSSSRLAPAPAYDPLAPRLRPAAAPDPRAREKEARKAKARLAELERQIGEKEQRVKDVEGLMASPALRRSRPADEAVTNRQKLSTR